MRGPKDFFSKCELLNKSAKFPSVKETYPCVGLGELMENVARQFERYLSRTSLTSLSDVTGNRVSEQT